MALVATVTFVLLGVGGWLWARRLSANPKAAARAALVALLFLLAWLYGFGFSGLGLNLIRWDDFVFFERLPIHASVLFILGICWWQRTRFSRALILSLVVIFGAYALLEVSGPLFMPLYASVLDDTPQTYSGHVEVMQSTGWTCGPAALTWALRLKGLPVTERSVAMLTATTPFHGTPSRGELRAAHRLGIAAHLRRNLSWDDLVALPKPAVLSWRLGVGVLHSVALIRIHGDKVTLGDPMLGETDYDKEEFMHRWMRDALVLP